MKLRRFGNTDLMVSPLCFGTMRYASKSGIEDAVSANGRRALEEAIERGVNFIHSSYEYGTRWLTGSVLERHPQRKELLHIIKVNTPDWGQPAFDKAVFRQQVEQALRELHTDRIAVVQHLQRGAVPNHLGYCSEGEPERLSAFDAIIEPLLEVFAELHKEGKVGYLASFPYMGYARRAQESGAFSGIVAFYNLIETEMRDLFDAMEARGQGFIGIRGLMGGLLTDARVDRGRLPAGDRYADPVWDRSYEQLDALRAAIGEPVPSWTDLATRFAVADPRIASTVVGINSPEQLRDVLAVLETDGPLDEVTAKAHALCTAFRKRYGVKASQSGIPVR